MLACQMLKGKNLRSITLLRGNKYVSPKFFHHKEVWAQVTYHTLVTSTAANSEVWLKEGESLRKKKKNKQWTDRILRWQETNTQDPAPAMNAPERSPREAIRRSFCFLCKFPPIHPTLSTWQLLQPFKWLSPQLQILVKPQKLSSHGEGENLSPTNDCTLTKWLVSNNRQMYYL